MKLCCPDIDEKVLNILKKPHGSYHSLQYTSKNCFCYLLIPRYFYLDDILDRERQRLFVIHESDGEQRPNIILIDELKGLGFDHHLAVAAAKLAEDAECDMGDLIAGVAEGAPQRLHQLRPHLQRRDIV